MNDVAELIVLVAVLSSSYFVILHNHLVDVLVVCSRSIFESLLDSPVADSTADCCLTC